MTPTPIEAAFSPEAFRSTARLAIDELARYSSGSLGNFTALLAARQAIAGYDIWTDGQGRPMSVLIS